MSIEEKFWTHGQAVALARMLEEIAPSHGFHVGLTGGTLYKDGPRKDCDILLYRVRQDLMGDPEEDRLKLFKVFEKLDIVFTANHGWVTKALFEGRKIDFLYPEFLEGEYVG